MQCGNNERTCQRATDQSEEIAEANEPHFLFIRRPAPDFYADQVNDAHNKSDDGFDSDPGADSKQPPEKSALAFLFGDFPYSPWRINE
jgi:hypothetical protein